MKKNYTLLTLSLVLILSLGAIGCSSIGSNQPKQVVISMFGAMEKDDKAALAYILDLPELMKVVNEDYALQSDNPRTFTSPQQILEDLTEDGQTKLRWFAYQRIINKEEILGETATVEVTFMDKDSSKAYLVKFGLHLVNEKWKIYSFNTVMDPQSEY